MVGSNPSDCGSSIIWRRIGIFTVKEQELEWWE